MTSGNAGGAGAATVGSYEACQRGEIIEVSNSSGETEVMIHTETTFASADVILSLCGTDAPSILENLPPI